MQHDNICAWIVLIRGRKKKKEQQVGSVFWLVFFFGLFFELPKALVWYAESCADLEEFLKKRSSSSNKSKAEQSYYYWR
jgi:hypothetical protein